MKTNTINITLQTAVSLNTPSLYETKTINIPLCITMVTPNKGKENYLHKSYVSPVTRQMIRHILSICVLWEKYEMKDLHL